MMTQAVKGKSKQQAEQLFSDFHGMLTSDEEGHEDKDDENAAHGLGNLRVFAGVREFPVRVKCATLAWHTMHAALNNQEIISTE